QTDDSTRDTLQLLIRPHHRVASPDTPHSLKTWYGTRTQTILLISQTPSPNHTEPNLGIPIWMGDDPSRWRRFDFQSPS
ncbi:hypothetical protein PCANC_25073, partial [Puccinia coronata f. sp. avenae]